MNVSDMKVGLRYIVTQPSVNEEFRIGDRIRLLEDGDILLQGWGWINAEGVPAATAGMEVELDKEWFERRRVGLLEQLEVLES